MGSTLVAGGDEGSEVNCGGAAVGCSGGYVGTIKIGQGSNLGVGVASSRTTLLSKIPLPQTLGLQTIRQISPLGCIISHTAHGSLSSQVPFPALAEVYAPILNTKPNTVPKIIFLIAVSLFCFEITSYGVGESQARPNTQDTARIIITNAVTSIRAAVSAKTAA